ncbi:alpha-L-rhamnosidase C-terminal domain-containing protein [Pedobacter ginsengisoli]|uniref:alpha-L-rhamnosidase-related protein n=1 Tax=Pedobacter ginsengisoli TaxID=363852 RepID=UPI00254CA8B0|nr:alpha-L-rhamnosidase C-terminal domain-containing protein [Pedobacter ginsengisoli]
MKIIHVNVALFLLCVFQSLAQNRPTGLLTDLLSNTDRVYINGLVSSIPLWTVDGAIEPVQFAQICSSRPFFSWVVPGKGNGTVQTAYQIIVADSLAAAMAGKGTIWDSKRVQSVKSVAVLFEGSDLRPSRTYFWRVKTFTNRGGESEWSDIKAFRTGEDLSGYRSSFEPLVKTMQAPEKVSVHMNDVQLFDFGKDAFGQLQIRLTSDTGLDTVQVSLGEAVKDGLLDPKPGGTIRYYRISLPLMKGKHTYRIKIQADKRNTGPTAIKMPAYIGEVLPFRYAQLEGYKKTLVANQDVIREIVHYPFNDAAASFTSSNDTLNKIWELCKYSIKATSFAGIYVDGDRERIPYEADALINQLGHYGVDREYSMARRSAEYLLQHPTWPTEWILQALIISWNDYLYTGDVRSLTANYELLKNRTLMALKEKNGLISTITGLQTSEFGTSIKFKGKIKDIVDWPVSETDGFVFNKYNAVTNAFHYRALVLMEKIAAATGNTADVRKYAAAYREVKEVFNKYFLNKQLGIYKDGDTTSHASLHSNMFALHFGLVPERYVSSVMKFIRSRGMACSVYGSQFLMDALYDGGDAGHALELLTATFDRSWYNMIKAGSTITLEAWDNKFKPNQDWNHAWGAAPANIIPRRLMGIEPLKAGFELIAIRPQTADLSFAESLVPTIRGDVRIKVQNNDKYLLSFTLPANMEAEVYLPLIPGKHKVLHNGKPITVKALKRQSAVYAGRVPSGIHVFEISGAK